MINVEVIYKLHRQRLAYANTAPLKPLANQTANGQGASCPQANVFWKMCEEWGATHPIHSHPYLDYIFDPSNDDLSSVKCFVEVLYTFCSRFHDCLFEMGANTRDEEVRRAIAYNLYDEYGSGNARRGHLRLMRDLLNSMGYSEADIDAIRINPGAEQFMDELLRYCREEGTLKALGCVCVGAECNGSTYFRKIYRAFQKKACMRSADLGVLELHAGDDEEHRASMIELITPYLKDADSRRMMQEGFLDSVHLFQQLWTSMAFYEGLVERPMAMAA